VIEPAFELLQLSLRLQGRTFGAPGLTARTVLREQARATEGEQSGREDRREAARVAGVSPLRGGSFAASFGRGPYVRGGCRARHPRHRPPPVPAATSPEPRGASWSGRQAACRCASRREKGQLTGAGTPRIVRVGPSTRKGTRRSFLTASQKASSGPTLARGATADPAGLTARARPEARPRVRAANLCSSHDRCDSHWRRSG
jgi:hypothetical protein